MQSYLKKEKQAKNELVSGVMWRAGLSCQLLGLDERTGSGDSGMTWGQEACRRPASAPSLSPTL